MWGVIERNAKLAGHRPATLQRVRGDVAEPFKCTGGGGRWLWRLIGDERDWSEGDIADLFASDPVGRRASGGALPGCGNASGVGPQAGAPDPQGDDEVLDDDDDDDDDEEGDDEDDDG
jgi:hypothetical protein